MRQRFGHELAIGRGVGARYLVGLAGALRDPAGHTIGLAGAALRAIELPVRRAGDYVLTVFAPDGDITLAVTIPVGRSPES